MKYSYTWVSLYKHSVYLHISIWSKAFHVPCWAFTAVSNIDQPTLHVHRTHTDTTRCTCTLDNDSGPSAQWGLKFSQCKKSLWWKNHGMPTYRYSTVFKTAWEKCPNINLAVQLMHRFSDDITVHRLQRFPSAPQSQKTTMKKKKTASRNIKPQTKNNFPTDEVPMFNRRNDFPATLLQARACLRHLTVWRRTTAKMASTACGLKGLRHFTSSVWGLISTHLPIFYK